MHPIIRNALIGGGGGGGAPAFSPIALFQLSEKGIWYDPSDLSTMFQDSAGSIPVTADGQYVGRILDKSGNGRHATQPTAAFRPLYKTDGTHNWLQFDGVDDFMDTASIDFTSTNTMTVFGGIMFNNNSGGQSFIALTGNPDSSAGSFRLDRSISNTRLQLGNVGARLLSGYVRSAPVSDVLTANYSFASGGSITLRSNGAGVALTPVISDSISPRMFANADIYLCSQGGATANASGRIYSTIVLGRLATIGEISQTETWVADKTGVTLS